jgi:hypothetical protein
MILSVQCGWLLVFLVLSSTSLAQEPQILIEIDRAAVEEILIEGLSLRRNRPSCMGFVSLPGPSEVGGTDPIHAAAYTTLDSKELEPVLSFRLRSVTNSPRGLGWINVDLSAESQEDHKIGPASVPKRLEVQGDCRIRASSG